MIERLLVYKVSICMYGRHRKEGLFIAVFWTPTIRKRRILTEAASRRESISSI